MSSRVETKRIDLYRKQILPWHKKVISEWDRYIYKVLVCGRKARKTTFDVNELFYHAMTDTRGLKYPFIGPTRQQAKEIVWDDHIAKILRVLKDNNLPFNVNNSDLIVSFDGYGQVAVDGSDNVESLRGASNWGGGVADEFGSWKNKRYAWEEVIEPNLLVNNAWWVFSGTPTGVDYFHSLMKMGDHENIIEYDAYDDEGEIVKPNSSFKVYRATSYDNIYNSKEWLDEKRERTPESSFQREYMARIVPHSGLVFKEFEREIHIVDKVDLDGFSSYYRTMDFGAVNPTACLFIKVDNDENFWIYDEYYETNRTTQDHALAIRAKHPQTNFVATFGDPSGKQERIDYAQYGVHITPANKQIIDQTGQLKDVVDQSWILHRIDLIQQRLKINPTTKKPRLFISKNCVNTIREFESYRWKEQRNRDLNEKDMPEKADDHTMDALGYFVVSYKRTPKRTPDFRPIQKVSPITGY